MLPNILISVRISLRWVAALDAIAKWRHEEALVHINAIELLLARMSSGVFKQGQSKYWTYAEILKGFALVNLERHRDAIQVLAEVQKKLSDLAAPNDESRYLQCYAALLGQDAIAAIDDPSLKRIFDPNFGDFDIALVPSHVRRNFPLRLHPEWQE